MCVATCILSSFGSVQPHPSHHKARGHIRRGRRGEGCQTWGGTGNAPGAGAASPCSSVLSPRPAAAAWREAPTVSMHSMRCRIETIAVTVVRGAIVRVRKLQSDKWRSRTAHVPLGAAESRVQGCAPWLPWCLCLTWRDVTLTQHGWPSILACQCMMSNSCCLCSHRKPGRVMTGMPADEDAALVSPAVLHQATRC